MAQIRMSGARLARHRMNGTDPIGRMVGLKSVGRSAPDLARQRRGRRKYDDGHKPGGGYLAQEYDENGAHLPLAEISHASSDDVQVDGWIHHVAADFCDDQTATATMTRDDNL